MLRIRVARPLEIAPRPAKAASSLNENRSGDIVFYVSVFRSVGRGV